MPRKLKYDIPGADWRVSAEALSEPGLAALFAPALAPPLSVVVDVGFGRGEFLLQLAEQQPETAFLGVEYSFKRVLKMARQLARSPVSNVRLVEAPAERVVAVLPPGCVREFWVNFPDPWPKKRHHRRRLIQPPVVRALVRCLEDGGRLRVATDHPDYAEQIDRVLSAENGLENRRAPAPWSEDRRDLPSTAYELEWRAEGRPLHFFDYRAAEAPQVSEAAPGDGRLV